jgi:succinate dehydrogenase iron-sulfur subunit
LRLRIRRSDGARSWEQSFEVPERPGMTVLDALFYVQENLDPTLAFRYSCHWAVCGSCAMLINGVPRLACNTPLAKAGDAPRLAPFPGYDGEVGDDEIVLSPLPSMAVIKDLVVDQTPFFRKYRAVRPVFGPDGDAPTDERRMDRAQVGSLERYTNCILCAACYAACPVVARSPDYLGPAALAKLYRFAIDPREGRGTERLTSADLPSGWGGCQFYTNCRKVCPKGVPPDEGIARARAGLRGRRE